MNDQNISSHLRSSYLMISSAFPNGINDDEYFPLLELLYNHFSDTNLAEVISQVTGKDPSITLNDIYRSVTMGKADKAKIKPIENKLSLHGFEEWLKEE